MAWLICGHCGRHNAQGSESCASCGKDLHEPLHEETEGTPSTVWLICGHCDRHNAQGSESCASCGKDLHEPLHEEREGTPSTSGLVCGACGNQNAQGSSFCSSCGTKLGLGPPAKEGPPVVADTKSLGEARPPVAMPLETEPPKPLVTEGAPELADADPPETTPQMRAGTPRRKMRLTEKWAIGLAIVDGVLVMILLATVNESEEDPNRAVAAASPKTEKRVLVSAPGHPLMSIESGWSGYEAAKSVLRGEVERGGTYKVSSEKYLEVRDAVRAELPNPPTAEDDARQEAELARWKEQRGHWDNLEAFENGMATIGEDRVVNREESAQICASLTRWETQLREAKDYVIAYRQDDPGLVSKNYTLYGLEERADKGLGML